MNARSLKGILLAIASILALISSAAAQPTATDLSYYPLHRGNVWLYRVYQWTPQGEQPYGWREDRIVADTLLPNGKAGLVFNDGEALRVDSTTGVVHGYLGTSSPSDCPDTTEYEVLNLSVDSPEQG